MSESNAQIAPATQPQARGVAAFSPYAQSPLHAFGLGARARAQDASCGVWMNEVTLLGYVTLRGDAADPAFNAAIREVLGVAPPTAPNTLCSFAQGVVLWQAPDEWLLVCVRTARTAYVAGLESALALLHAQVVDNSGGMTALYLGGASQVEVLRHVGVYDFETLTAGRVVSTICSKANLIAYRLDGDAIFVVFRRSFADYLWRLLEKAARPYGLGIGKLDSRSPHPLLRLA
jgi:sarcosine oxidase subunit gamma